MNFLVFLLGLLLVIFAHPKVMRLLMTRLFNEGLVAPRQEAPEKSELIRGAGPNFSLFFIGIILIIISLLI